MEKVLKDSLSSDRRLELRGNGASGMNHLLNYIDILADKIDEMSQKIELLGKNKK